MESFYYLSKNTLLLTLLLIFLSACGGKHQENLKRLDGVYGVCDNPGRILTKRQYDICKMKERNADGSSLGVDDLSTSLAELVTGITGGTQIVGSASFANRFLWQASLEVLSPFPIKIADNGGGYIETDWIIDFNDSEDKRCQIKIMIRSSELISTGLKTTLNCQNFNDKNWVTDNQKYVEEEKNITLKILQVAQKLSLEVD